MKLYLFLFGTAMFYFAAGMYVMRAIINKDLRWSDILCVAGTYLSLCTAMWFAFQGQV